MGGQIEINSIPTLLSNQNKILIKLLTPHQKSLQILYFFILLKFTFQETTTSRRLALSSLNACTDYDFEIVPWIDDYMAEDDSETAEVHTKFICRSL